MKGMASSCLVRVGLCVRSCARVYARVEDTEPDSAAADLEKYYLTTVDILDRDGDYAPVGTWGSRNNLWGSTAAAAFGRL